LARAVTVGATLAVEAILTIIDALQGSFETIEQPLKSLHQRQERIAFGRRLPCDTVRFRPHVVPPR
jgi:hypothetical protein